MHQRELMNIITVQAKGTRSRTDTKKTQIRELIALTQRLKTNDARAGGSASMSVTRDRVACFTVIFFVVIPLMVYVDIFFRCFGATAQHTFWLTIATG